MIQGLNSAIDPRYTSRVTYARLIITGNITNRVQYKVILYETQNEQQIRLRTNKIEPCLAVVDEK